MSFDLSSERIFQNDVLNQMLQGGWVLGTPEGYNRETALYEQDVLDFVKSTQADEWEKLKRIFPQDTEGHFFRTVLTQLQKADINATDRQSRRYGTLGVLRHGVRTRSARFFLCQFKPEHGLNPDILANYKKNICRVVPELVYTSSASAEQDTTTGQKARRWRIDLVLFVNGFPVVTLELKSEFKQAVNNAILQYKKTRLPKDPLTNKPEPLLMFKRGALVHFAVSQYEVHMTTQLAGDDTFFLPFNKGTSEGGAGNDIPEDPSEYATAYLWNEVLQPDSLLNIIGRFVHLQIEEKEDWNGRSYKQERLIFPRYHQWDVVTKLIDAALVEGSGRRYLIQHSAGSGKSNSIAWTAHQLSSLHDEQSQKLFDSVIVVTDRTVLDAQLQDTIYQFEHADGVVGRITHSEGFGSKSEKLAHALINSQPIIIVTIQTFPFVLEAIENSTSLKQRRYAIIADEAHSSQSGSTSQKMREVLSLDEREEGEEITSDDRLNAAVESRRGSPNISFYAFTATPKDKTLQLFGRLPNPQLPPSIDNKPEPYHVYTMRQAIEEGFILDVLKNYTNYKVVYQLAKKRADIDQEVNPRRAKIKLSRWVALHGHNISQKVKFIVEHFKDHVMDLLGGQAKAMVVTSSRKEVVRYKQAFDKYVAENGYDSIRALVAFSGEVEFDESDPDCGHLIGEKFTERNMNPDLRGRDMRKAFDTNDYQVMLVANKFQTGFDQPKLCAMYVDKKLGGVECVQTLSRLNRIYPGKKESGTFIVDFYNDPSDIIDAFQPYYQTVELADVSDPDQIFDLYDKLETAGIFTWTEVENFVEAFFSANKSNAAISNICKPAVERWQEAYRAAYMQYNEIRDLLKRFKEDDPAVVRGNLKQEQDDASAEIDRLQNFKKDLGSYVRMYEFLSQIAEIADRDLEKLSLFARHLQPLLREYALEEDEIDLSDLSMTHYRLSLIHKQKDLELRQTMTDDDRLKPGTGAGTARPHSTEGELLSEIIARLNEIFITDELTDEDMVNYARTVRDKLKENTDVMLQIERNTPEQAMLGDFPQAIDRAIMDSSEAHKEQMMQLLSDPNKNRLFAEFIFDVLQGNVRL